MISSPTEAHKNGTMPGEPVWFRYLLYPILLTLIGLVGTLLF